MYYSELSTLEVTYLVFLSSPVEHTLWSEQVYCCLIQPLYMDKTVGDLLWTNPRVISEHPYSDQWEPEQYKRNTKLLISGTADMTAPWRPCFLICFDTSKTEWAKAFLLRLVHTLYSAQKFGSGLSSNSYLLTSYCLNWGSWEKYRNCLSTWYCHPRHSHVILFCMRFAW